MTERNPFNAFAPVRADVLSVFFARIAVVVASVVAYLPDLPAESAFPERTRYLFLDPAFAETKEGVSIEVNPPVSKEIVIRRDTPMEAHMIGMNLTVLDEGDKIRMWYNGRSRPGKTHAAYAESLDGVRWEKPDLGLYTFDGSKNNNIYGGVSQAGSLFRDPNAKSGEERFVFVSSRFKKGGVFRYTSPDGFRWKMDEQPLLPFECDSQNVCFWDDNIRKYVLYLRGWNRDTRRKVVRCETERLDTPAGIEPAPRDKPFPGDPERDPFVVEELPTVLKRDDRDPPNCDIYTNAIQPYPPDRSWYVGFPAVFRHDLDSPLKIHSTDGRLEIQFVASRDGVRWERFDRSTYVGPGSRGEEDAGMIFMGVGLVVRGDEIWQYGVGFKTTHADVPGRIEMGDGVIYRYVQRIDGFVSLDFPAIGKGRCVTAEIPVTGSRMLLNLDAGALGDLGVGLLDENGKPLPGYSLDDSRPVTANDTGAAVSWKEKDNVAELVGRKVRVELSGSRVKLYSIRFENSNEPNFFGGKP